MSEQFLIGFRDWEEKYGLAAVWLWRLILYPLFLISLYAGKAYLDGHYVSKDYFDKVMTAQATEQRQDLSTINGKLDALLFNQAANSQRFSDYDRRIGNVEEKVDRLQERSTSH